MSSVSSQIVLVNQFHLNRSEDGNDEKDYLTIDTINLVLAMTKGQEILPEHLNEIQKNASNKSNRSLSLNAKYILCGHVAYQCGFIEPNYFVNLTDLLSTNDVMIRQCIMWAFTSILPCKNLLSPLLIQLLYKSLKNETLGWSISYLFLKVSEYEQYIPMVADGTWLAMSRLLFDQQLSEQVRTTIVQTLTHVFKVRKWISPVIKIKFERLIMTDRIPKRLFIATINALHSMAIGGVILEKETVEKLRQIVHSGDDSILTECIHELLDFLDHKRILSNSISFQGNSHVKKELTISQNTSISRSEEESTEPTSKFLSLDHLLGTVGHLDRKFNTETQPNSVSSGHNQAWYRSTLQEIDNLAVLAKKGQLKDQDFNYLQSKFTDGFHFAYISFQSREKTYEIMASVFRDAAKAQQYIPSKVIDGLITHLTGTNENIHRLCAETLLIIIKNQQDFEELQMNKIEETLIKTNDFEVKQYLIEIYAYYISKGHHLTLTITSIEKDLLNTKTCLTASYLFYNAAAVEKLTFSNETMEILIQVTMSNEYDIKARHNCIWALTYSIREIKNKQLISLKLIDNLGKLLIDSNDNIKQTAAAALCYYGMDEQIVLSTTILEQLAGMLIQIEQSLLHNIASLYRKMSKQGQHIPVVAMDNLSQLLQHPDISLREKVIWTLKHTVDNGQDLPPTSFDLIDLCLNDLESRIRNPAAKVFIIYWTGQLMDNNTNTIRRVSARMETLLIIFRHSFESKVRISALDFLQRLVEKNYDIPESLLQLIELCLYNRESSISIKTIAVVESYSQRHSLPKTTIICLEHLLITETPILSNIITLLKSIVNRGHILSSKTIDILGQLILKINDPKDIVILLTFADRNQPLPKSIDELLRQIYYAKVLNYSTHHETILKAIQGLLQLTFQGQRLSLFVLNLLFTLLMKSFDCQKSLMPILLNVISNGQHINNNDHRNLLTQIFLQSDNDDPPSVHLMTIFALLSRQNQAIPDTVIKHLQTLLTNPSINLFVIEIYQHLIERQKSLDSSIIQRILTCFRPNIWKNLSMELQQRLTSFFNVLANNRPNDVDQTHLPSLLQQLQQSTNLRREICLAIQILAEHPQGLLPTTIDALLQLLNDDSDTCIQEIALKTLDHLRSKQSSMSNDLNKFINLFNCNTTTNEKSLLKQLRAVVNTGLMLPDVYLTRLSHMLYSCDIELKKEAAIVLALAFSSKQKLPKKVIDAIYLTLLDESINQHTLPMLFNLSSEWPSSVIDDLLHLVQYSKQSSVKEWTKQLLTKQKETNLKVRHFLDNQSILLSMNDNNNNNNNNSYVSKMILSSNVNDVCNAFKIIRAMIIIEKQVSNELLFAVATQLMNFPEETMDLLICALNYNIQFNDHVCQLIQNEFVRCQTEQMLRLIRILAEKAIILQEKTLKSICLLLNQETIDHPMIILEQAAQHQQLPTDLITYLTKQLSQGSKEFIQKSFNILRRQILQGYVKYSKELLKSISFPSMIDLNQLVNATTIEQSLGTIQTLLFVNNLDSSVFIHPPCQWSRQCLCIELLTKCPDQTSDRIMTFYYQLTQFELFKNYQLYNDQRDAFLQALIEKQRLYHLDLFTINQILIYSKLLTNLPMKYLQSNEENWLIIMRTCFIQEKLDQSSLHLHYSKTLLDHLVERISQEETFLAELIELFLRIIRTPDDILTILHLVATHHITSDELISLFADHRNLNGFDSFEKKMKLMIINKTLMICLNGYQQELKCARHYLQVLFEKNWQLTKLNDLLHMIEPYYKKSESFHQFLQCLKILIDYNIDENILNDLRTIFSHHHIQSWSAHVHALVIENRFGSTSLEKNLTTILTEIEKDNTNIRGDRFDKMFKEIDRVSEYDSTIFLQNQAIKNWKSDDIQNWATQVLSTESNSSVRDSLSEILAIIKRAVFLHSNFEPRPIQILAVLIMLHADHNGGRLLQILTGEGKSIVVSMLAVIKALQGHHVDIITSSITLAKRDADEREHFYNLFKLTVSHNNDETSYVSGPKSCYKANIVYGNSSQFQFDLLRHEFSLLNTRTINISTGRVRRCDVVIIDEVDSMLIDENNTIARLADQLPGMEWLNPLLYGVWRSIEADSEVLSNRDSIVEHLKDFLTDSKSAIKIPTHLYKFFIDSLPTWVDHAIRAKIEYRLDHHYMIKADETRTKRIVPIDFSNTGVVQASTTWSDGLHQFLQIKHGLKMTPLTVTTNYLSNVGLFTRYGQQIYGLTGTIGSKDAQNLLFKIYKVDTIIIPPFKKKRHIVLESILTMNDDQWLNIIVSNSLNNVRNHRAILIICETRLDAKTITKELKRADPTCFVRLYTDNTDAVESNVVNDKIQQGEIIVATNLAGRGTDLKTSPEVEKHGGLHVCLTFLPNNLRVEDQAFGRTSRQGNRGTSQMILSRDRTLRQLINSYPDLSMEKLIDNTDPITYIRHWREQAERAHLDRIWNEEIDEIKVKDELFKKFCELLARLRQLNNDVYRLMSVKEHWGLWLKSMDHAIQNRNVLQHILKVNGYEYDEIFRNSDSFFHALSHQIEGKLNAEDIKTIIMKHIDETKDLYTEMNNEEEQRHWAACRALNINLTLYRSDYGGPFVYEQENALYQCLLGYEMNSYYVSLKQTTMKNISIKTKFNDNDEQLSKLAQWRTNLVDKAKTLRQNVVERFSSQVNDLNLRVNFERFEKEMIKDYQTDAIIRNCSYLMLDAEMMIEKYIKWTNTFKSSLNYIPFVETDVVSFDQIINRLKRAVEIDPIFAFNALTNHAYCLLYQGKLPNNYKVEAKTYLTRAQQQIGEYILPQLYSMQLKSSNISDELVFLDFAQQIQTKVNIIQIYQDHLAKAIAVIEESQKLIDVTATYNNEEKIGQKLYRNQVNEFIETCQGSIDVSFHHLTIHHDCSKKDQAIHLFEKLLQDEERVSIHFVQTNVEVMNKIPTILQLSTIRLNIQYLNNDEIIHLIENIPIDLTITATSIESYLIVIKTINTHVTVITDSLRRQLSPVEAMKLIDTLGDQTKSILFKSLTSLQFKTIQNQMEKVHYELTFNKLNLSQLKEMIKTLSKPYSVEFHNLTILQAKSIVNQIDDRHNFVVTVLNLTRNRAQAIVKSFDPNEQDLKSSLKRLTEQFPKTDQPHEELITYNMLGISVLIIIDELSPRPWISASIVVALGVGQIVGGVCLAVVTCGLGVSLGISLIGEGVNDLFFGIRGAISRRFSWKDYAIQKGVSLTICFVTLGCSAVKQAAQAAKAAGTTGTTSMLKATGRGSLDIVKNSFSTVGSGPIQGISSESWKLALEQVMVTCAETGFREIANYTIDGVFNQVLSVFTESIRTEIERIVNVKQAESDYERILNRAIAADKYYENNQWREQMEQLALQLMSKQRNKFVEVLKSLSTGITNAFLNHSRQFLQENSDIGGGGGGQKIDQCMKLAQFLLTIAPMIKGSYELVTITNTFFDAYKKELAMLEQKIPTFEDLLILASNKSISMQDATVIHQLLVQHKILSSTDGLDCRFTDLTDQPDFVGQFFISEPASAQSVRSIQDKLLSEVQKLKFDSKTRIYVEDVLSKLLRPEQRSLSLPMFNKKIIDFLVEQVCVIIHGTFITPLTNLIVARTIPLLSTKMQLFVNPKGTVTEQLMEQGAKRHINVVADNLFEKLKSGEIVLDPNATEKLKALQERTQNDPTKALNDTEKWALEVMNDKQGNNVILCVLAMITGTPISVLQQSSNDATNKDPDDKTIRLKHTSATMDETTGEVIDGHYDPAQGAAASGGGPNACLYASVQSQVPDKFKSIDDMKTQVAAFILTNPDFIAGIHPAVSVISRTRTLLEQKVLMGEGGDLSNVVVQAIQKLLSEIPGFPGSDEEKTKKINERLKAILKTGLNNRRTDFERSEQGEHVINSGVLDIETTIMKMFKVSNPKPVIITTDIAKIIKEMTVTLDPEHRDKYTNRNATLFGISKLLLIECARKLKGSLLLESDGDLNIAGDNYFITFKVIADKMKKDAVYVDREALQYSNSQLPSSNRPKPKHSKNSNRNLRKHSNDNNNNLQNHPALKKVGEMMENLPTRVLEWGQ